MTFTRARQDDQKLIRRQQILDQAEALIIENEYSAVNMAQIAAASGVAKGTLFLYFPTKETLFLTITENQLSQWFQKITDCTQQANQKSQVIECLLSSVEQQPLLPKLLSLLHGILEHNVDEKRIHSFKTMLRNEVLQLGALIDKRLKWNNGAGAQGLLNLHTILIGSYQMANPSPAVLTALMTEELSMFRVNLQSQLQHLLPLVFKNNSIGKK